MKKTKFFLNFILVISVLIITYWDTCESVFENIVQTFEPESFTKYRIDEKFSEHSSKVWKENRACRPETPLSKAQLFERAIQDHFNYQLHRIWRHDTDDHAEYYSLSYRPTFYTRACDLQRDKCGNAIKIGNNVCLPQKIKSLLTFDDFKNKLTEVGEVHDYNSLLRDILKTEPYRIETDTPIYLGKFYNRNTDFSVISVSDIGIYFYAHDCCRLLTYEEAVKDSESFIRQSENSPLPIHMEINAPVTNPKGKGFLLRIAEYYIHHTNDENNPEDLINNGELLDTIKDYGHINIHYYNISECGNILNICANCGVIRNL